MCLVNRSSSLFWKLNSNGLYFNFAQLLHIMNYLTFMFLQQVHSPSVGSQQALNDCFKGGSVKILIFGFGNSLWLYLESVIENLPKLPLAAT